MARRVYLHIGTMKSATTYLQGLFDTNRRRLDDAGILWPTTRACHQAAADFGGHRRVGADAVGAWQRLRRQVRAHDGDALISSELIAPFAPGKIARLVRALDADELRVIITARDITRVVPSHWQETTQNRGTMPWQEWVDRACKGPQERTKGFGFWSNHDLPGLVRKWSTAASPGHLYLVTVPKDNSEPDLVWRRFATVLEGPFDLVQPTGRGNPALGAVSAEVMRRVNHKTTGLTFPQYAPGFKRVLAKQVLVTRAAREPRPGLTDEQYSRLRELGLGMVKELRDCELNLVGDFEDLVPTEDPPGHPFDPSDVPDSELLDAAIDALAGLGSKVGGLQSEAAKLRRRPLTPQTPNEQRDARAAVRWHVRKMRRRSVRAVGKFRAASRSTWSRVSR